jgi:ABC-type uncharacterized transport system permease subunit
MENTLQLKKQLITLLGTESKSAWMNFMEFLDSEMKFLSSKGRPSKSEIEKSIIGESGFTSWQMMCDSATSENGLGWSYNTYRLWKKSWNVVCEFPYLKELELSASEINSVYLDCNKQNIEFPNSAEDFGLFKKASKSVKRAENAQANEILSTELSEAKAKIQLLTDQIEDMNKLREENAVLRSEKETFESDRTKLNKRITTLKSNVESEKEAKQKLKNQINALPSKGFMTRLSYLFTGNI